MRKNKSPEKNINGLAFWRFFVLLFFLISTTYLLFLGSRFLQQKTIWLYFALEGISIFVSIVLFYHKKNKAYIYAWIIIIIVLPVFGFALYLLWGRSTFSQRRSKKLQPILNKIKRFLPDDQETIDAFVKSFPEKQRLIHYFSHEDFKIYKNTHCSYFPLGEEQFEQMLIDMQQASSYIFIEYFIVKSGLLWDRFEKILIKKAHQGIEIRIMYDDFGSILNFPYALNQRLRDSGIQVITFNPLKYIFNGLYLNYRNHQKITIIDGRVGYIGGTNLADEYANLTPRFGHWKDTAIRLEGDAVMGLCTTFFSMWEFQSDEFFDYKKYYPFSEITVHEEALKKWREPRLFQKQTRSNLAAAHTLRMKQASLQLGKTPAPKPQKIGTTPVVPLPKETKVSSSLFHNIPAPPSSPPSFSPVLKAASDFVVQQNPDPSHSEGYFIPYADNPLNNASNPAETAFLQLISSAQKYLYITTPYLVIDSSFIELLCTTAQSGVDIRIITPKVPDHWYVHIVTRSNYNLLLQSGVRIFEYSPGFIHAKTMISDDFQGIIGSINLDYRSLYLHFENAVWICNSPVLKDIKKDMDQTLAVSEEITYSEWQKRPRRYKILEPIFSLFSPLF